LSDHTNSPPSLTLFGFSSSLLRKEGRRGISVNLTKFCDQNFPLLFSRRGGQTQKSSDLQKFILSVRGGLLNSLLLLFILMDSRHLYNGKSLKPVRSFLRNNSTSAESVLCNQKKSKNLEGKKLRRQQSINHSGRECRIVIIL